MFGLSALGKLLILLGVLIIVIGILLVVGGKIPWIGKLPGDFIIKRDKFTFYFPLTTCVLVSLLLTLLFSIVSRK